MAPSAEPLHFDGTHRTLDPKIKTVWMLTGTIPGLLLGAVWVFGVLAAAGEATELIWPAAFMVIWCAIAIGIAHLRWNRWSWSTWPDAIDLHHGVIVAHQSVVPYHRIQQIDIHRGPLERALGLATLILRTAAATTDAKLPGIPSGAADSLRHELLGRSGLDDAV